MNYGKLRCLGTQTRLKAKFGSGYQLQFHCEKGRSQEVEEFVQTQLPHAIHTETYAGIAFTPTSPQPHPNLTTTSPQPML